MGLFDILKGRGTEQVIDKKAHMPDDDLSIAEKFRNTGNKQQKKILIRKISDQHLLAELIRETEDTGIKIAGLKNITDQSLLEQIVLFETSYRVKSAALWEIKDPRILQNIVEQCDHRYIQDAARERLASLGGTPDVEPAGTAEQDTPVTATLSENIDSSETDLLSSESIDTVATELEENAQPVPSLTFPENEIPVEDGPVNIAPPTTKVEPDVLSDEPSESAQSSGKTVAKDSWDEMYQALKDFHARNGHCRIPANDRRFYALYRWLKKQVKSESLSDDQRQALDDLGVFTNPLDELWNQRFEELKAFKAIHGHTNVPKRYAPNRALGEWVIRQRIKKDELPRERKEKLEAIGFDWDPQETHWQSMYRKLLEFRKVHHHCNVPVRYEDDPELGTWVSTQRKLREKLPMHRVMLLNKIDFDWNPQETIWQKRYIELLCYKQHYGDCNVPDKWKENPELANWVAYQRRHKSKLPAHRIKLLDEAGFNWGRKKSSSR